MVEWSSGCCESTETKKGNVATEGKAHKGRVSGSMVELNFPTLGFLSIDVWWSGQVVEVKIPRPKKGNAATDSMYITHLQEVFVV